MTMIRPNSILPSPFAKNILANLKTMDSSVKKISGLLEDLSTTAKMNTWILITMIFMIFCIILLLMIRLRRSSSIDLWSDKIRRWNIKSCYIKIRLEIKTRDFQLKTCFEIKELLWSFICYIVMGPEDFKIDLGSTYSSRPITSSNDIDQEILEYTEEISSSLKVLKTLVMANDKIQFYRLSRNISEMQKSHLKSTWLISAPLWPEK